MATISKKEMIERISDQTSLKRVEVKEVIQALLDNIITELVQGNRLEFRDFGVFETKVRAARTAQNPKTLEPVEVGPQRTVRFRVGRMMKQRVLKGAHRFDDATGLPKDAAVSSPRPGRAQVRPAKTT